MSSTLFSKSSFRFTILLILLLFFILSGKLIHFDYEVLKAFLLQQPFYFSGPLYVICFVVLTCLIWFSKDVVMLVGAWVFGLYASTLLVFIGECLNAVVLFHLSRKLGKDFVDEKTRGKLKDLDTRFSDIKFGDLFALRAIILIPFRFLDLGAGLSKISFKKYMTAVSSGSIFRVFVRQYFLVFVVQFLKDGPEGIFNFVEQNHWVSWFAFGYLSAVVFLFVRLKKIWTGK